MVFTTVANVLGERKMQKTCYRLWIVSLVVLLGACAGSPAPTKYHSLLESAPNAAAGLASSDVTVGIGNVTLPRYLSTLPIAHRVGGKLLQSDNNLWSQPLGDVVPQALVAGLSAKLPSVTFMKAPFDKASFPIWRIFVRIERLEAVDNRAVELDARWSVIDRHGKTVLIQRAALESAVADGSVLDDDMSDVVAAHREVLAALGDRLVEDIRRLPPPK